MTMFRCMILMVIVLSAFPTFGQEPKPPELTPEEQALAAKAAKLNREGVQLSQQGKAEVALEKMQQAFEIRQKLYPATKYPDGHPDLATSLNNQGQLLLEMGQSSKALLCFEQALAMRQKLYPASKYPDGHPELASSLNNLAFRLEGMGQFSKALSHYEQALAMRLKLYPTAKYPDGHPNLALSLSNLGVLLRRMGQLSKALPYFEQALEMRQKLYSTEKYPDGHPDLATSINSMGILLKGMDQLSKALPYYEQALAMNQTLYPAAKYIDGHPHLASSLNNLGGLLWEMGQSSKALPYYEQALAMRQKLYPTAKYPDGHPDLAANLGTMGFLLKGMGQSSKALPYYEQALAMSQTLGRQILNSASEAEALVYFQAQPLTRDLFLDLTRTMPDTEAKVYATVWSGKSIVTRVQEQRHAAARVAGTQHAGQLEALKAKRRTVDALLRDMRLPKAERDGLLTKAVDERDALERALAKAIPLLERAKELDALGFMAISPLLPDHAVLIDFVRYTRFEYDPAKPGKSGEKRMPSYVAFVLAKGQALRRIELGDADVIDRAITEWRSAIESRSMTQATSVLRERVWAKLAPHLPTRTKTLYLALDGDLARLPWAALPIATGRVLLEEYALANVPHGRYLLEQLKYPRTDSGANTLLALGGVEYGVGHWPALPGTATEVKAILAVAPDGNESISGTDATVERLKSLLPKARYAHLATHGEFNAGELSAERKRALEALAQRQFGDDTRRVAAKNPLGFVGLVLANGKVFSGLNVLDLTLENLHLVTLSACETGLGELTGGEGVQGLQRAFHLAGCPNVVASLWKVNDAATAALMAKFYHEMWVNKKPPIEALREAQLTIYRHPELIPDLAGERGAVRVKEAVGVKPGEPSGVSRRVSDTKLWAAFVLSGVGK